MLVVIDTEVLNSSKYFDDIDKLIFLFIDGKHTWLITDAPSIEKSQWFLGEGRMQERFKKLAVKSVHLGKKQKSSIRTIHITLTPKSSSKEEFQPAIAKTILESPLYIILENFSSDKAFLDAIIKAYNHQTIQTALSKEWIKIDTTGGTGQIPKKIAEHFVKANNPRLFVLVDSDKVNRNAEYPDNIQTVIDSCKEKSLPYHILGKRAIENYIPEEALKNASDDVQDIYDAYCGLTDEQKDFYDLKKGFSGKGKLPEGQAELFNKITSKDELFKKLRAGLGSKELRANNLHTLFKNEAVSKENLEERCRSTNAYELKEILEKITQFL